MSTDTTPLPASPPAATAVARPAERSGYLTRWARVPRELGFLLPTLPIVLISLTVLSALFTTGVGSLLVIFGIFLVLAALFAARGFGVFELLRLQGAGFPPIRPPAWDRLARGRSGWAKVFSPAIDGHYWLYLLHGMIV
ncbi:MAG TPA: sensor domain-containing protein, partial [Naasia sp.]